MRKFNLWNMLMALMITCVDGGEGGGGSEGSDGAEGEGAILDGGADGQGGDGNDPKFGEEGYLYGGKYLTQEELDVGYREQQTHFNQKLSESDERFKAFKGAPEGDYELPEGMDGFSEGVTEELQAWGKEKGLSQEGYAEIVGKISERLQADNQAFIEAEFEKLGGDAQIRIDNLNDKWAAQFGADSQGMLEGKIITAEDAEFYEGILSRLTQQPANPEGGDPVGGGKHITSEALDAAMFKKDSMGGLKTMSDPEYKKTVEALTAEYNKQRGIS